MLPVGHLFFLRRFTPIKRLRTPFAENRGHSLVLLRLTGLFESTLRVGLLFLGSLSVLHDSPSSNTDCFLILNEVSYFHLPSECNQGNLFHQA